MGEWTTLEHAWYDTKIDNCELCGRMIAKRAWLVVDEHGAKRMCGPKCESVYRSYWLPRQQERETAGS